MKTWTLYIVGWLTTQVQILALPLPSYVILGELHHFSGPQFPDLLIGYNYTTYSILFFFFKIFDKGFCKAYVKNSYNSMTKINPIEWGKYFYRLLIAVHNALGKRNWYNRPLGCGEVWGEGKHSMVLLDLSLSVRLCLWTVLQERFSVFLTLP